MNPEQPQPGAPMQQPAPQPMGPAPMGGQAPMPMPMGGSKKKMNPGMIVGIIVAVLLIAGGIAYGVYAYVTNQPDNMLQAAVTNLRDQKSLAASFQFTSGTKQSGATINGSIALKTDPANSGNGEVLLNLGTLNFSALSVDGTLYLKGMNLETLGTYLAHLSTTSTSDVAALSSPEFAAALKNLDGEWFSLTKNDIQSLAQGSGNSSVAGAVSPSDLKKLLDIYNQHPFIKADKSYADEVIDGSNSAHFSVKPDKNTTVAFMQAVKDANLSTIQITDQQITDAKNAPAPTGEATVEVWIARDTKQLKQLRLVSTKTGSEFSATLTLTSKLPTFDAFTAPSGSKPISSLLSELLGTSTLPVGE